MASSREIRDPLQGSAWSAPDTVAGFLESPPNVALMQFAERERASGARRLLDIGCGAGRNAVPLAAAGWDVLGTDLSMPMLTAAAQRASSEPLRGRLGLALAAMDALPVRPGSVDLVIAHGIWNLARSSAEFRIAVAQAARAISQGGALFVFTFSRHTLPPDAPSAKDELFVFTQFSGSPQCFLTAEQLLSELADAGFEADPGVPLRELNLPSPGMRRAGGPPVIYEGTFRRRQLTSG